MRSVVLIFLPLLVLLLFLYLSFFEKRAEVVSPIGRDFYGRNVAGPQLLPPDEVAEVSAASEKLELFAESALSFDLGPQNFLYKKNIKEKRAIASLAKIMTAIIALEKNDLEDIFYVSEAAASVGEDSMGLSNNERYSLKELLYGLFLVSGNDAAEAIAENVGGERETFIRQMNDKAEEIGLLDTYFVNPSGLPENDRESISTAYDLLLLTKYAILRFPSLKEIAATKYLEIPYTTDHKYLFLENVTNLLGTYPGVSGFKTGYTEEAGLCLITLAKNDSHEIIIVILKSSDRRDDATRLLDYSFELLGIPVEHGIVF